MHAGLAERAFRLMAAAPIDGCLAEFGVYKGDGLSLMAHLARRYLSGTPPIYGFDSFEGMPATAAPLVGACAADWAGGTFSDTSAEAVRQRLRAQGVEATVVKGLFGDLPPLADLGMGPARFVHVDADIYEGYRDALRLLGPHLRVGTVLLFDEVVPPTDPRYQSVRMHGKRAVEEWERATELNLHHVRTESTAGLFVIVDEAYLRRYAPAIIRLRGDTVRDVMFSLAKASLGPRQLAFLRGLRKAVRSRGPGG